MTRTLRDFAAEQLDAVAGEYGAPPDRDQAIERWMRTLAASYQVPDDILEAMPEVSRHDEPQVSPQEHECGCVVVTRITDRDSRHNERPFEMRLAMPCDDTACKLAYLRDPRRPAFQRQIAALRSTCPYDGRPVTLHDAYGGWKFAGLSGVCLYFTADHRSMVLRVEHDPTGYWPVGTEVLAELDHESVPSFSRREED